MPQTPFHPPLCPWPVRPADVPKPVMTVNGKKPDAHGNVVVEGGSGGEGDVKHSDFADMRTGEMTNLDAVIEKVDTLIVKLKGTASLAFALLSLSTFGYGPTTRLGEVHRDTTLREVVVAGGAPVKVSDLTNDAEYVTAAVTNGLVSTNALLSTKVSTFTNDAEYVTAAVTNGLASSQSVRELVATNALRGFVVGASRFSSIPNAIRAVAGTAGDATIEAYEDFGLSGEEDWDGVENGTVRIRGRAPGRGVTMTFSGPAGGNLFRLGSGAGRFRRFVLENVSVAATQGVSACRLELRDVGWRGPLVVKWPGVNRVGGEEEPFAVRMRNVDLDAAGGKYAVDVTLASNSGDVFEDCVFRGFARGAVDFVYHRGNAEFRRCVFDGSSVTRADTVALVNFQGPTEGNDCGDPLFESCVFRGLRREIGGHVVSGPAIADRMGDGQASTAGLLTLRNNVFEDTVAYMLAFGDPFEGRTSTHIHFNVTGGGNVWRSSGFGSKMVPVPGSRGSYTGVGYVGDAPETGEVVEIPWEGAAAQGTYGTVGRGPLSESDLSDVEVPGVLSAFSNDLGFVDKAVTNGLASTGYVNAVAADLRRKDDDQTYAPMPRGPFAAFSHEYSVTVAGGSQPTWIPPALDGEMGHFSWDMTLKDGDTVVASGEFVSDPFPDDTPSGFVMHREQGGTTYYVNAERAMVLEPDGDRYARYNETDSRFSNVERDVGDRRVKDDMSVWSRGHADYWEWDGFDKSTLEITGAPHLEDDHGTTYLYCDARYVPTYEALNLKSVFPCDASTFDTFLEAPVAGRTVGAHFFRREIWVESEDRLATTGGVHAVATNLAAKVGAKLDDDFDAMTNSVAFTDAVATVSPPTDLSDYFTKYESSTNATAKAKGAIAAAGLDYAVKSNSVGEVQVKSMRFTDSVARMVLHDPIYGDEDIFHVDCDGSLDTGSTCVGYLQHLSESNVGCTAVGSFTDMGLSVYGSAFGTGAFVDGDGATAVGHGSAATGNYALALGSHALAFSAESVVIGTWLINSWDVYQDHGTNTLNFATTDDPKRIYFREKTLYSMIGDVTNGLVSASNPAFSNAVTGVVESASVLRASLDAAVSSSDTNCVARISSNLCSLVRSTEAFSNEVRKVALQLLKDSLKIVQRADGYHLVIEDEE